MDNIKTIMAILLAILLLTTLILAYTTIKAKEREERIVKGVVLCGRSWADCRDRAATYEISYSTCDPAFVECLRHID